MASNKIKHQLTLLFFIIIASTIFPLNGFNLQNQNIVYPKIIAQDQSFQIYHGGQIESIRVEKYNSLQDILNAMENGEVDLFGQRLGFDNISELSGYQNIEELWAPDTKLCMLAVNSRYHPLNDVYLRRAIAYAIDKNASIPEELRGYVDVLDFALPLNNEFSIEASEGGSYYNANVSFAIHQLELAGMLDVDEDTMVEGDDGKEVCLNIWYPVDRAGFDTMATEISANLYAIGLNNTLVPLQESEISNALYYHNTSYDLAIYDQEIPVIGLDWIATTFSSTLINTPGENVANINSQIFNNLAYTYQDEIEYDSIVNTGLQALRNVQSYCPVIPLFSYSWLSLYTEINFNNWIADSNGGAISAWNPVEISPVNPTDSELVVGVLPEFFNDFYTSLNPFKSEMTIDYNWAVGSYFNPYRLVYDSAIETAPNGEAVPRESTSWEILYLGQIPDIMLNQQRIRFYCDSNANWTDGEQFDAQDYRFTFGYYRANNLTSYYQILNSVKITGDYRAGVTLNSRDLFNYRNLGVMPLLPEHIWEGKNPKSWEPTIGEAIGSGPFKVQSFTAGESLKLVRNDIYYPVIDTEPPVFQNIELDPETPIPAESVVVRIYVSDRSIISNVTLIYTHEVGSINFTDSRSMRQSAIGYIASIPARVTADKVFFEIYASDIWGNSAIVYSDSYSIENLSGQTDMSQVILLIGGIGLVAIIIIGIVLKRR